MRKLVLIVFGCVLLQACSSGLEPKQNFEQYTGPTMVADSVEILYSDSAVVRVIVKAPKQLEFENGDREFPHHIFIEFYEPDGTMSSTLEANSAYYTKETDTYKAEDDVEVIGYTDPRKMNTEELYWEPQKEEIYSEKFVRIESEDQISTGTGLRAKQDFSSYRILNPSGTIYLDEQEPSTTKVMKSSRRPDSSRNKTIKKNPKKEG